MRQTAREAYAEQLQGAVDTLRALRRTFEQDANLNEARSNLREWRSGVVQIATQYGERNSSKLLKDGVDLEVLGFSGSNVLEWFQAYEDLLTRFLAKIPTLGVRGGYADDVRIPLEQIDELLDWLLDSFQRSMQSGQLDYQTAEEGLRRWRDHAYKILIDLVGEEEAARIYRIRPANATVGNPDGSVEDQYEMYLKYLDNLKEDLQKYPHHLTAVVRPARASDKTVEYVNAGRLRELRAIHSHKFDLSRLVALCDELNITAKEEAHHATGMLVRAIMDHVPPIFGQASFVQVASNYAGSRSFKEAMGTLESAARKIGDAHLHTQIRSREILPTFTQVNFSPQLDLLLAEIVRVLK